MARIYDLERVISGAAAMSKIKELLSDSRSERLSVKHTAMMIATVTLSLCSLMLTPLSYLKPELVPALIVFGGSLASIAGGAYVMGKPTERKEQP